MYKRQVPHGGRANRIDRRSGELHALRFFHVHPAGGYRPHSAYGGQRLSLIHIYDYDYGEDEEDEDYEFEDENTADSEEDKNQ